MINQVLDTTPALKGRPGRKAAIYPPKIYSFRLTGEESAKLDRRAAAMGMTPGAYIQRIMRRDLNRRSHHKA